MKDLKLLIRPNIQALPPFAETVKALSSSGKQARLDANESPHNAPHNRYPDPAQTAMRDAVAKLTGLRPECICMTAGTEEAIDLVYRVFCTPGKDNVVSVVPTRSIYKARADINDVEFRSIRLEEKFSIKAEKLLSICNQHTKAILLCSPNNPTGNLLQEEELEHLLDNFDGMVVMDESYADFSDSTSIRSQLPRHHNLIVLNSFSHAQACAGSRIGFVLAIPPVAEYFHRTRTPHNISYEAQVQMLDIIGRHFDVDKWVKHMREEKTRVMAAFRHLAYCEEVFPSESNFFLARFKDAQAVYRYLQSKNIAVADCSTLPLCENCLRITIGLPNENSLLLGALRQF